jgi:hypothetical protein
MFDGKWMSFETIDSHRDYFSLVQNNTTMFFLSRNLKALRESKGNQFLMLIKINHQYTFSQTGHSI